MKEAPLKTCPFCGGPGHIQVGWYPSCMGEIDEQCPGIVCVPDNNGDSVQGCEFTLFKTYEEAVEKWNDRKVMVLTDDNEWVSISYSLDMNGVCCEDKDIVFVKK